LLKTVHIITRKFVFGSTILNIKLILTASVSQHSTRRLGYRECLEQEISKVPGFTKTRSHNSTTSTGTDDKYPLEYFVINYTYSVYPSEFCGKGVPEGVTIPEKQSLNGWTKIAEIQRRRQLLSIEGGGVSLNWVDKDSGNTGVLLQGPM
ncbi:11522_t:CDS:2, partial [Funneliformis mosseae]